MRPVQIGLVVALVLAALSPSAAWAAKAPATPPVSKEDKAKGMAAAPALVAAAKADCQVSDARRMGESVDPKTKQKTSFYELACGNNEGLVIAQTGDEPPLVFTCLEAGQPRPDGKPSTTQCVLPENADPKAALTAYIAKTGMPCTLDNVRALGHNAQATLFELVCKDNPGGFILQTSAPPRLDQPVMMNPCIGYSEEGSVKCTLTDRATQLSMVDRLMAGSGKPCTVKDRAYIGASGKTGDMYFEVACQEGKGYVLEENSKGALSRAIDCVDADAIAGGCKLTDTRQAKTEQNRLYSQLAKKAGFNCDVSGYAPLPRTPDISPRSDVVEITCANRPDGAIAVFPAESSQPATIWDCAHSEMAGYRCSMSKPSAAYAKLSGELASFGKKSCSVSNARFVGITADGRGYNEVACADGLQGYMIEYTTKPQIAMKSVIVCSEAKGIAGGCALPGNTAATAKKG
jgi:hypothetical protein